MRKWMLILGVLLFSSVAAQAQDPGGRLEVFAGVTYGQFNTGLFSNASHASVAGWHIAPALKINRFLSFTGDFSEYFGSFGVFVGPNQTGIPGFGFDAHFHDRVRTYSAGPEIGVRVAHLRPFAHALVGVTHGIVYDKELDQNGKVTKTQSEQKRLSYALGGGVDVNLTKHVSLRAVQIDWFRNNFSELDPTDPNGILTKAGRQNNVRISAGVVFRFGVS